MDSKHSGLLRLLLLQTLIPICLSSSAAFMANEFFPASADGQQHFNGGATTAAPTEEDLIARLLKGPGLPPGGPPLGGEEPPSADDDRNGADKSKQNSQMPSTTLPPLPPADNSLPVLGFSKSASHGLPPSAPPSYIQCLYQVAARVCDVDNILQSQERTEIDETLRQLEAATRKENAANECERSGLKLMIILVRHSALLEDPMNSVQKKLNDALGLWVRDPEHKCDKPVVLMLSADPQMVNRKVWTGRHWDVPVPPSEMVQLFMAQEDLTRKEKYGAVILNILDGLLSKYEQRALGGGEGTAAKEGV